MCEDVTIIGCKTSGYALGTMLDGTYQLSDYRAPDDVGVLGRIKLGTDSVGGFRNILVTGCTCENSRGLPMGAIDGGPLERSEEHTSELQSLMHRSYAGFCFITKTA